MTADELRHIASQIASGGSFYFDDAANYLRACADALEKGPVAWRFKPMLGSPWSLSDDGDYISCKRDKGYIVEKLYPLAMPAPLQLPEPPA